MGVFHGNVPITYTLKSLSPEATHLSIDIMQKGDTFGNTLERVQPQSRLSPLHRRRFS